MAEDPTLDNEVRHFIYQTFISTSKPPTTAETAKRFQLSISRIESTFQRLAASHDIALAPGSHSIWMAHPFSALPTNYIAQINQKNITVIEFGMSLVSLLSWARMPKVTPRVGVESVMITWICWLAKTS